MEVTVIIPNWNGKEYISQCLDSLKDQSVGQVPVIVVDNASEDGSRECVAEQYPWVKLISLEQNYGFCRAVNEGIRAAQTKYVILLNNDIRADRNFVRYLLLRAGKNEKLFSCQAKMLQMDHPDRIDNAGDQYCALGWAYTRGKDCPADKFSEPAKIFSACGGAVLYRREVFDQIGLFDEAHFAYLEDVDVGYRAQICGYENWYEPQAVVYHKGSAATGSRHNTFKVSHASRNNIYLIYKNMPLLQIILNLPFLAAGFLIKFLFFAIKGMGKEYAAGIKNGFSISMKNQKVPFRIKHLPNYCKIQLELWINIIRRFRA